MTQETSPALDPRSGDWVSVVGWTSSHLVLGWRASDSPRTACGRPVSGASVLSSETTFPMPRCGQCLGRRNPLGSPPRRRLARRAVPGLQESQESLPESIPTPLVVLPPEPPIGDSVELVGGGMSGRIFKRVRLRGPDGAWAKTASGTTLSGWKCSGSGGAVVSWGVLLCMAPAVIRLSLEFGPDERAAARRAALELVPAWEERF